MSQAAQTVPEASVGIRRATADDAAVCGQICYDAFAKVNLDHGFPPDFPSPDVAREVLGMMFSHPGFYCVVAESGGSPIGSNCMDERCSIAGIGPITVNPAGQNLRTGRKLMDAVLRRAEERGFAGVRLVQATFHNRSLALYTTLGFDPRELLSCMQGPAIGKKIEGCAVRPAENADLAACNELCRCIHGHDRAGDLADAIDHGAVVVERHGRITGYSTLVGFFGHTVAETNLDLQAILAAADGFAGPGILVPVRNAELFRWCLAQGLRVVEPLTLMTIGLYNEPAGAYLPSILF
ncbi:MAG: GNAT family N-acetyltransferase [Acidobacteriia bacterium]|nr:GNAT family N-acetyltransferase [Terriglobia bacterium]